MKMEPLPVCSHEWFVGIDWATQKHRIHVMKSDRKKVAERDAVHSGEGIAEFLDWLDKLCSGQVEKVAIGIETPRGAIVESLMERGYAVYSLNPKQLDRFRDRHTVAGAKDDSRDALVLADSLRTDRHSFHRVDPSTAWMIRLRELSRTEEELVALRTQSCNRLREQLHRYFTQILELSPNANDPWIWELLEATSLPAKAAKLKAEAVTRILKRNRIRKWTGSEVVEILGKPSVRVADGAAEAASEHVLLLIKQLQLVAGQRADVAARSQALLDQSLPEAGEKDAVERTQQHRDAAIVLSLPGVGRINGATILSEAGKAIADRDYDALRAYCGIAPVTRQSGKAKSVAMRRGCSHRLRNACHHWGMVSIQHDQRSKSHYKRLRERGASHGQALRCVVDRLLLVMVQMLKTGTPFDSARWNKTAPPAGGDAAPQTIAAN